MESSQYLSELSKCVRCGSCKAFCPTYDEDPSESMGARGRLALLWGLSSGQLASSPILNDRIFSCMLCGTCSGLCPLEIDIKEVVYHGRSLLKKKGRVAVFTGCTINFLYPYLGESLINVLHRLGYEVILPSGEVCCGAPLRTLGLEKAAIELAKKNLGIFSRLNVDAVLSLCPTCTLAIKVEYPKLIGEGIDKAVDISSFIIDKLDPSQFSFLSSSKGAIYHDPCHLKYGLGIEREPREIIENIGFDLIETEGTRCCGFAGVFSLSYKKLSQGLLNKCIMDYTKREVEMIITACPGCMIQLTKGIKNKPVLHLIEVIEEAMFQQPWL